MEYKRGDVFLDEEREVVLEEGAGRKWSIRYMDNGSSMAWFTPTEESFIRHEDESIFQELDKKYEEMKSKHQDLSYIKSVILTEKGEFSSHSVLVLFEEIDFPTSFLRNGEYFALWYEFDIFLPAFKAVFNKDLYGAYDHLEKIITEEYIEKYKNSFKKLYNKVNREEE